MPLAAPATVVCPRPTFTRGELVLHLFPRGPCIHAVSAFNVKKKGPTVCSLSVFVLGGGQNRGRKDDQIYEE